MSKCSFSLSLSLRLFDGCEGIDGREEEEEEEGAAPPPSRRGIISV